MNDGAEKPEDFLRQAIERVQEEQNKDFDPELVRTLLEASRSRTTESALQRAILALAGIPPHA